MEILDNPLDIEVSVISVVYNDAPGIKVALESAVLQKDINFEIIVIDGGSTDGTASAARGILENFKNSTVVSEKDNGIYHAINKGIKIAHGKYVLVLNAGDWFYDDFALSFLLKEAESDNKDYALGRCMYYYPQKDEKLEDNPFLPVSGSPELCHQTFLYSKSFHDKIGYYNEKMRVAADYDFFCKLKFRTGLDFVKKNRFIVVRGKYGNDASDQLSCTLEKVYIDIRYGLIFKTWPKRAKSVIARAFKTLK